MALKFVNSVPAWLSVSGPVLLQRRGNSSKYDPVVEEVDLVHSMPNYAVVRFPSEKTRLFQDSKQKTRLETILFG